MKAGVFGGVLLVGEQLESGFREGSLGIGISGENDGDLKKSSF